MFGIKSNRAPLLVEVTETRWNSYGDPNSYWAHFLHQVLVRNDGISDSVSPGLYDFNIRRRGLRLISTLEPHKE